MLSKVIDYGWVSCLKFQEDHNANSETIESISESDCRGRGGRAAGFGGEGASGKCD